MRFTTRPELELFAESVRAALAGWEAPLEPVFGTWQDDRDDALAARLADVGWAELWGDPDLLGPAVAGGVELGRAVAPVVPRRRGDARRAARVGGRVRHGAGRVDGGEREPTLDGTGTLRGVERPVSIRSDARCGRGARSRSRTWRGRCRGARAGDRARAVAGAVRGTTRGAARGAGASRRRRSGAGRAAALGVGGGRPGRRHPARLHSRGQGAPVVR